MDPADFELELQEKAFTCREVDFPFLLEKYGDTFKEVMATVACLKLDGHSKWDEREAGKLARALPYCLSLQSLHLAGTYLSFEGVQELLQTVARHPALKDLDLGATELGIQIAPEVANMLEVNNTLQHLKLAGNCMGDNGSCVLAKSLGKNTALLHLDLEWNNIGDIGAFALAEALVSSQTLLERLFKPKVDWQCPYTTCSTINPAGVVACHGCRRDMLKYVRCPGKRFGEICNNIQPLIALKCLKCESLLRMS